MTHDLKRALAGAIAALALSANAEFYTGNDLLTRIQGDTYAERGAAIGYIMGVSDTTLGVLHCAPASVTSGQIRDLVHQHLIASPGERHHSADRLVLRALQTTWPCAQRQQRGGQAL